VVANDLAVLKPDTSQPPVSVQRTDLSIDVLGRFLCSTWDEAVGNGGAPFDVVILGSGMFGAYAADKIYRDGTNAGLRILILEASPFLVSTHVQNLPNIGLNVPNPMATNQNNGQPQDLVWGLPWRSNQPYIGLAYCVGGKSLFWGGWCPRLLDSDLKQWPSDVAPYLNANYRILEDQTGTRMSHNEITKEEKPIHSRRRKSQSPDYLALIQPR
jgi:choline dehydrogenase-like flavoprotein